MRARAARRLEQILDEARAFLAAENEEALEWCVAGHGEGCSQSPIDAVFHLWWMATDLANDGTDRLRLVPQRNLKIAGARGAQTYALDFVVEPANPVLLALMQRRGRTFRVGVQLNRHGLSDRRQSEIENDRQGQALVDDGWTIYQVCGSELLRDSADCVQDVYVAAIQRLWELESGLIAEIAAAAD